MKEVYNTLQKEYLLQGKVNNLEYQESLERLNSQKKNVEVVLKELGDKISLI